MKTVELPKASADQVKELVGPSPVYLVGSYLSTFLPTNLPSGTETTRALYELVFGPGLAWRPDGWRDWLEKDFRQIPFEGVMECYPDQVGLPTIIGELYGKSVPNDFHELLAEQLVFGSVAGIVTTNYDLGFDSALVRQQGVQTIVTSTDSTHWQSAETRLKPYFKIHGCASQGHRDSLVFRLAREGRLPGWKQRTLERMLEGRVLVVMGYSGRDFDICPELARLKSLSDVVWLVPEIKDLTPNANRVLGGRDGTLLVGDACQLIRILYEPSFSPSAGTGKLSNLDGYFDNARIEEWRVRILDWLACYTLGLQALSEVVAKNDLWARRTHCSLLGHAGKYRTAAQELLKLSREWGISTEYKIGLLIGASGSLFSNGSHLRSLRLLREAARQSTSLPPSSAERGRIDIQLAGSWLVRWMRVAQIARILRIKRLGALAKNRALPEYTRTRNALEESGDWGGLQATQHNAERIGIADASGMALEPIEGYYVLGLRGMECIRHRDDLRRGGWWLSTDQVSRSEEWIRVAKRYGWNHEAWKLSWILLWRSRGGNRLRYFRWWFVHFFKTQYALSERLRQLVTAALPQSQS
jgi:hypothetical protein